MTKKSLQDEPMKLIFIFYVSTYLFQVVLADLRHRIYTLLLCLSSTHPLFNFSVYQWKHRVHRVEHVTVSCFL
jgi:hypothetical protein